MGERVVLLLSGPVAAGKSTLGKILVDEHRFRTIRSGRYLQTAAQQQGVDISRRSLQALGDSLDVESDYRWLIDDVAAPLIESEPSHERWLLDSVRKVRQVEHFRGRFGNAVFHVHIVAPEEELRRRYDERLKSGGEYEGGTPYDAAIAHPNEVASRGLRTIADLVVDASNESGRAQIIALIGGG